jgi:flagellar hook-associated protein 1 FlgK
MSSISSLYTSLSGINAQQRTIDTIAHNLANQSTEGYRRQRVELRASGTAATGVYTGSSSPLRGVDIIRVSRSVDLLAERRLATETGRSGYANKLAAYLGRVETAITEPSDVGIAMALDDFWGAWSDLTAAPRDPALRSQLLERATAVSDNLHRAAADFNSIASAAADELGSVAANPPWECRPVRWARSTCWS